MAEKFEFAVQEGEDLSLYSAIHHAIGAASVCWSEAPRGVFESERAKEIARELHTFILENILEQATSALAKNIEELINRYS